MRPDAKCRPISLRVVQNCVHFDISKYHERKSPSRTAGTAKGSHRFRVDSESRVPIEAKSAKKLVILAYSVKN